MAYELYLYHHGVQGQKWGVRNGPPYPLRSGRIAKNKPKSFAVKGASKENLSSEYDHTKSKKAAEVSLFLARFGLHAITLNPIGLTFDAVRLSEVVAGIAKERSVEKRIANNPKIDKRTGLHLKENPSEWDDAKDLKQINPAFKTFDANRKNNCMLCSVAYDMRKRGYDVMANHASSGYLTDDIKRWYPKAKVSLAANSTKTPMEFSIFGDKDMMQHAITKIESQGEGTRGAVFVKWNSLGAGHAMAYQIDGGKMQILDGQSGKVYHNPTKILKEATSISYVRLDNIDFDPKKIKECVR